MQNELNIKIIGTPDISLFDEGFYLCLLEEIENALKNEKTDD